MNSLMIKIDGEMWHLVKSTDQHFYQLRRYRYFMYPHERELRPDDDLTLVRNFARRFEINFITVSDVNRTFAVFDGDATYALFCLMDQS